MILVASCPLCAFSQMLQQARSWPSPTLSPTENYPGRIHCRVDLAARLPNSDLNFAVDFWVDFILLIFQGQRPKKIHLPKKSTAKFTWKLVRKNPPDFCRSLFFQKFRKGVGGQRGLARRNPSNPRDSGLFSVPFFLCPLRRRGTHFRRILGALFWGLFVANPLPPTPVRNL